MSFDLEFCREGIYTMNTISIELSPQEAGDLLTCLREVTERLRQSEERMSAQDEEFKQRQHEIEATIARISQGADYVERTI